MTCIIRLIIDTDNARAACVVGTPESEMAVIKALVNHANNHTASVIGLRQSIIGTVQHLSCMGGQECGISTQVDYTTDLDICDTRYISQFTQLTDRHLSGNKAVKLTVDPNTIIAQNRNCRYIVNINEGVHHLYAINHFRLSKHGFEYRFITVRVDFLSTFIVGALVHKEPNGAGQHMLQLRITHCQRKE